MNSIPRSLRVLLVEDDPADAELVVRQLHRAGLDPEWQRVDTEAEYLRAIATDPDLILSDYDLPQFSGLRALELLKQSGRVIPFIVISGTIGEDTAVAVMKLGAADYLLKDRLARLGPAVAHALNAGRLQRQQHALVEAVREAEASYRSIFENTIEGIYRTDSTGRFLLANPAMARILGYASPAELVESPVENAQHGYVDRSRREEFTRQLEARGVVTEFESEMRRRDGRHIWIAENAKSVREASGRLLYYEGTVEDITARKLAEEKIREQAALLDHASDAIYARTLGGTIQYWNEGAERLYGWTRAEAVGRNLAELNLRELDAGAEARSALTVDGSWAGERVHVTKGGRQVQVFAHLTVVRNQAGEPASVFAINTDITERKQLEAQILQAQRLENLGALASGIAHDLNNVLAPVLMATEILKERLTDPADRRMVATMAASAKRGADIVRQVLTFARGVKGERVPVPIRHLLREMTDIAAETFPPTIRIELDAPRHLWPVLGDATQLHQILMNLCINARDAMPHGGSLTLAGQNIELDEAFATMTPGARAGPHICVKVTDTGTGIAPDHLGKIFDPFFTTKEKGQGTGLGLSTVLGIAKSHGGFVRVNTHLGTGTCFEVYLPAAPDAELPADRPAGTAIPRGAGETILIVEDEPATRAVASRILEHFGYRPVLAADGSEAMAVYVQLAGAIAVVVTDMVMPGMDGPTLIRTLRRINPHLPIVGMTGFGERFGAENHADLGLPAILMKPFTADKLLTTLHDALHGPASAPTTVAGADRPNPPAAVDGSEPRLKQEQPANPPMAHR